MSNAEDMRDKRDKIDRDDRVDIRDDRIQSTHHQESESKNPSYLGCESKNPSWVQKPILNQKRAEQYRISEQQYPVT